ncbi:protein of unknown function [Candidatus Promineifilum breve]|uniref:Uncharacterized protein n=1 Tax=Candidatus Promineifilum breve TaxID=1806508 RepID=A0A170PJJ6_9CHLR|nr:protein of unknown function [Candidatus Promineifilum breve]
MLQNKKLNTDGTRIKRILRIESSLSDLSVRTAFCWDKELNTDGTRIKRILRIESSLSV